MANKDEIISAEVKFVIGNGGAGITGFVQYLAKIWLKEIGVDWSVAWRTSDTEETLKGLKKGTLDVGWPYGIERVCKEYKKNPQWKEPHYIFRDHFALAGPQSNPGKLASTEEKHPHVSNDAVYEMFRQLTLGNKDVVFLTRDDNSATNVLERTIFTKVLNGRAPDVTTDKWYVKLDGTDHYPDAALRMADKENYYTLTDRGIWTWADPSGKSSLKLFCEAGDTSPDDILLNPCIGLSNSTVKEARQFVEWLAGPGQKHVEKYKLHGDRLYSKAPAGIRKTLCD